MATIDDVFSAQQIIYTQQQRIEIEIAMLRKRVPQQKPSSLIRKILLTGGLLFLTYSTGRYWYDKFEMFADGKIIEHYTANEGLDKTQMLYEIAPEAQDGQ